MKIVIKKRFWRWLLMGTAVLAAFLVLTSSSQAQVLDNRWRDPRLLSTPGVGITSAAEMVTDAYGRLHVFWREEDPDDAINTIQYALFDGDEWSDPIDIFVAPPQLRIESISAAIDDAGVIHLIWNEGNEGPVYYSRASVQDAQSARAWSERVVLTGVNAFSQQLQVDSRGVLHVVFINFFGDEPGVYYIRSFDGGESWSSPYWIDPDIPLQDAPNIMDFQMDEAGGLHLLWYYLNLDTADGAGDWIRYTRSLDGGGSWSPPQTIDVPDDSPDEIRLPYPGLSVIGDTVLAVWAGNRSTQREYRYSLDRGETWSETERILGGLQGQALGDGLVADASGRLHFFGQIRWPQGLYHATWQLETGWSEPEMIYLIAADSFEGRNGRYHVHNVRAAILNGNQLVVTFTDEAIGPLYVMTTRLDDVTAVPPQPTPTPPQPTPTPTPKFIQATPTPTPSPFAGELPVTPANTIGFNESLWLGVLPAAVLLLAIIFIRLLRSN